LSGAVLSHADLVEAYLGGANLKAAKLEGANLTGAKLEEAVFAGAFLEDAQFVRAQASGAKFNGADAPPRELRGGGPDGRGLVGHRRPPRDARARQDDKTKWTGAKVAHMIGSGAPASDLDVGWVDASPTATGSDGSTPTRRSRSSSAGSLRVRRRASAISAPATFSAARRSSSAKARASRSRAASRAARSPSARAASWSSERRACWRAGRILGAGDITIHGTFLEAESPGIVGPRQLVVSAGGAVKSAVEQMKGLTRFAFEPGCKFADEDRRARSNGER